MRKTDARKWLLIVLLPFLVTAVSGCAVWRGQRETRRAEKIARRELDKKYDLARLDVDETEFMGRRATGVFVVYNTNQTIGTPERWKEQLDIYRICFKSFEGKFGFVQVEARRLSRSGREVVKSVTNSANAFEIAGMINTPYRTDGTQPAWPEGK